MPIPRSRLAAVLCALAALVLSAPPALAAEVPVSGRVVDDAGAALARARVELWPDLSPLALDRLVLAGRLRPEAVAATTTGRDGSFRLAAPEPGFWRLRIEAPDRLPVEVPLAPLYEAADLAEVELPAAGDLVVVLTGEGGTPLAGALVIALPAPDSQPRRPALVPPPEPRPAPRLAFTGEDGRATLPRAAGEALEVEVLAAGQPVAAVRVAPSASAGELPVRVPAGVARRVRVLGPRGQPAAGAVLEVGRFGLPAAVVGEDGLATVFVPVAGGSVEAVGDGGTRVRGELATPDPASSGAARGEPAPAEPAPLELRLLPPLEIAGQVLAAEDGAPLPGALLWIVGRDRRRAVAGPRGEFRLGVDPRALSAGLGSRIPLGAAAPGRLPALEALQLPVAAEGVTLRLTPAARLAGRVVDRDGEPVAGAEVVAWPRLDGHYRAWRGLGPVEGRSGAAGDFALTRLRPEGAYVVTVDHPGFGPLQTTAVAPAAGAAGEPLELVLPPAVTVRGRVLDAGEVPVAGARVVLARAEPRGGPGMPLLHRFGREDEPPAAATGADGRFAIPGLAAGRYDVDAEAPGFTPLRVPGVEVPEEREVDLGTLYLAPGAVLEGRVVGPGGRPLEGAEVAVEQDDRVDRRAWRADRRPKPHQVTGPDGRFRTEGLSAGVPARVTVEREGYARTEVQAVPVPSDEPLEIELLPASRLSGRVVGPGGEGVPHASVLAQGVPQPQRGMQAPAHVTAEDDGRFVLEGVPPGEVVLSARASGFLPRELPPLLLAPGEERSNLRLVLERGAAVAGRVTGPGGEPVDGAHAMAEDHRGLAGAITDSDGRFRLEEVPPGPVALRFEHRAYLGTTRELEVAPGGEHRLDVTLERGGEIAGRVLQADGGPAAAASLRLVPADPSQPPGRWPDSATSAADGSFRIFGLEAGRYRVIASKEGHASAESEVLEVVPGAAGAPVELRLEAGAAITGRVLGVEMADLARVELQAMPAEGPYRQGLSGVVSHDGIYRVEGVSPGAWQVVAELGTGQAAAVETVEVAPGQQEVYRDIELGTGHTLSGRVTLDGEPLPGARVMVMGRDRSRGADATTGPDGRFEVRGLPAGSYTVWLRSSPSVHESREVELAGDREIDLALLSGGIEGTVTDAATGAPVADAEITLERRDERLSSQAGSRRVDSGGGFRFHPVPAGRYEVHARAEGYVTGTAAVEVAPGTTVRADLRLEPGEGLVLTLSTPAGPFRGFARVLAFDAAALDAAAAGGAPSVVAVAQETVTLGSGRVRLRLPAGRWRLLVTASGHATATVEAAVPGEPLAVLLQPGAQLLVRVPALTEGFAGGEVRVRGADGRLVLTADGNHAAAARSLSLGRAMVSGLPPGTWTVEASAPDGRTWSAVISVVPGTGNELVLE